MSQLMDFLLQYGPKEGETAQVDIQGFPHPFVVRSITQGESVALRKACQRSVLDPKTNQRYTHTDGDLLNDRLIVACCVEPNLKDADLQKRFGVMGAEALLGVLLKPFQYGDLLLAVQRINGAQDVQEARDCAKK